ncbi:hypothetical protein [Paractinoplanes atraurantiacus]|uniref:Uncharacterized protein n=1 Tax=Paractinoplanes atraurantiacus TaxID=1036182 RepID=A0A285K901_9ACTN|nr:hypothetical protein [Actinoplanes atraurantiacus]SNY69065.1 hypothetical protein SAMN05421748_134103 [Actinoplanes atraurantiacus]
MTFRRFLSGGRTLLIGADPPRFGTPVLLWVLAALGAACLAHGGATYLDLKSGLPLPLCVAGGIALAAPLPLVVTRPLLAWRCAFLTAVVTGLFVQAHGRTPFSWHPAILALQVLVLVVIAVRRPVAVSAWAFASMALLVTLSFYPADRLPLMALVAVPVGAGVLIRRKNAARENLPGRVTADG